MRIGQFSDTFLPIVDGVGRVVYNYTATLTEKGHECYAIAPMADTGYRGGYPFELVDYYGAPVPGSPQYNAGIVGFDRHYMARMSKIKFDIVHAHTPFIAGLEALRVAHKQDIPLVGTFHSKYYDDFYKVTDSKLMANIGVKYVVDFYDRCDEVWAVSEPSAQVLADYGYTGDIKVMENGTEIRAVDAGDMRRAVEQFGLDDETPMLLYVGQLNWKKNIANILDACALLLQRKQSFIFVLAGQGPDRDSIAKKARELGIENYIKFTGHITDNRHLDGLYQRASLFVFPSLYDTSSLVMREAAVMQTPSVLTRGSAPAQVVEDKKNGFLADNDPVSLADVICDALSDKKALEAVGKSARETIPVSWDIILDSVLARYKRLVDDGSEEKLRSSRENWIRWLENMTDSMIK